MFDSLAVLAGNRCCRTSSGSDAVAAVLAFGGIPCPWPIQECSVLLEFLGYGVHFLHTGSAWRAVGLAEAVTYVGVDWSSAGVGVEKCLEDCRRVNCYSEHSGCSGRCP